MARRKRPWPLLAAILLLAVLTLFGLVSAKTALSSAAVDRGVVIIGALASVAINVVLIVGLVACKSWARWLTIVRIVAGAMWSVHDLLDTARRAGGMSYLPSWISTSVYATVALGAAIVVLLLFPSVTEAVDGRWMADDE